MACRVNAVCPGPILTEGTQRHADSQGVSLEAACQDMVGRMVMPRWVMQAAATLTGGACEDLIGRMTMPRWALQTGRAWPEVGEPDCRSILLEAACLVVVGCKVMPKERQCPVGAQFWP